MPPVGLSALLPIQVWPKQAITARGSSVQHHRGKKWSENERRKKEEGGEGDGYAVMEKKDEL